MPTAFLFPGQGSQTPDMREHVAAVRPDLLDLAAAAVGEDPFPRADEDTRLRPPPSPPAAAPVGDPPSPAADENPPFAQPPILARSLAGYAELQAQPGAG